MTLLSSARVEVYAQGRIAGTSKLSVLVGVAEPVVRFRVSEICGLGEQLRRVGLVLENIVAVARLVQKAKFVRSGVVEDVGRLGSSLEPLEAFAMTVR